ncbi:MAG: hypothetical protein QM648_11930 [Solirubrobacterales bacterium]
MTRVVIASLVVSLALVGCGGPEVKTDLTVSIAISGGAATGSGQFGAGTVRIKGEGHDESLKVSPSVPYATIPLPQGTYKLTAHSGDAQCIPTEVELKADSISKPVTCSVR